MSGSELMTRKPIRREPGELSDFDKDLLGNSAVRINIPIHHVTETLDALRKTYRTIERAIVILEATKIDDDRHALFNVKSLLRGCAMSLAKVKRRRF